MASLIVEIVAESSSLDRALSRTHANLSTANIALGTFAGNVAASFARMAVGAAGGLFEGTIRSASHLAETVNRVKVVLGDSADKVIKDADLMADRYGHVKSEVLGAVSSFSLLGQEMKLNEAGSADLGIKLTRMASELTSFFDPHGDLPAMMKKLESGLAGQVRPLRELGIFMTADAVKAQAAQMGLKPGASGQLSEGDKIRARIAFIENSKAMQLASGDLERTLSSTENQTRKFWGTLSNLGTAIGQELDPAWNKLLQSFNSGLDDLKGYFEANKSMVKGWGDSVVEGFETAKVAWRNLPDVLEIAMLGADQRMEDARARIEAWATTTAVYVEDAFLKAAQSVGNFFQGMQSGVTAAIGMQVGGVQSVAASLQAGAQSASDAFDAGVGKFAAGADVALRPLRDVANATGGGVKGPSGKFMSIEEDFNRMQGALAAAPKTLAGMSDFLKTFQSTLEISAAEKPKDFTSSLIDKVNKHLADTLAENTDISSRGIAVATARITKREAERLTTIANALEAADEEDILTSMGYKVTPKPSTGKGKASGGGAAEEVAEKHANALQDTASFLQNMAAQQLGGDVQERQLTELQAIREADQKNADMMEKMYNRVAKAVYA